MRRFATLLATAALCVVPAIAADTDISPSRSAFDKLKALEGTWVGKAGEPGSPAADDATVTYHVTAAGNAVMETLFPGTPHEMVTMYHVDGKDLRLTHYCAAGNQPSMVMKPSSDPSTLVFDFDRGSNMKDGDMHMHSLKLVLKGADALEGDWTSWQGGKPGTIVHFDMARKK